MSEYRNKEKIQAVMIDYFENFDQMLTWFSTPNPAFGDRKPADLLGTPDEEKLWAMVNQIDAGVAS